MSRVPFTTYSTLCVKCDNSRILRGNRGSFRRRKSARSGRIVSEKPRFMNELYYSWVGRWSTPLALERSNQYAGGVGVASAARRAQRRGGGEGEGDDEVHSVESLGLLLIAWVVKTPFPPGHHSVPLGSRSPVGSPWRSLWETYIAPQDPPIADCVGGYRGSTHQNPRVGNQERPRIPTHPELFSLSRCFLRAYMPNSSGSRTTKEH